MTVLELSISANYVRWSIWEAIREIIQNAKDSDNLGNTMFVSYDKGSQTLLIQNEGVKIGRETLVLGNTTKRNDASQIGEFAEGYKLALATFASLGKKVEIYNGNELWIPRLAFSAKFNSELLTITTTPIPDTGKLSFKISGITEDHWNTAQERLLFLPQTNVGEFIEATQGRILKDDKHKSKLYVKGIYVDKLSGNFEFGYDLHSVKLDRDRNMPNDWILKNEIREILKEVTLKESLGMNEIFQLLSSSYSGEGEAFTHDFSEGNDFHNKLLDYFIILHGEKAVPVLSIGESMEAGHYGFKGVVVSKYLNSLLAKVCTPLNKRKADKTMEITTIYSAYDLKQKEINNLIWAVDLVSKVEENVILEQISVVDFFGETMWGLYDGTVKVAKKVLENKQNLIRTIVHEYAHRYGVDGSVQHRNACERMFSSIISP